MDCELMEIVYHILEDSVGQRLKNQETRLFFFTMVHAKGESMASHKDTPAFLIIPEKVWVKVSYWTGGGESLGPPNVGHTQSRKSPSYPNQCCPVNVANDAENAVRRNSDTLAPSPRNVPFSLSLRTQSHIDQTHIAEHRILMNALNLISNRKKHKRINYFWI